MKKTVFIFLLSLLLSTLLAQNLDYEYQLKLAKDFMDHRYFDKAREYFILALNNPKADKEAKAEALYQLGKTSIEMGNYKMAIDDWDELINEYPESEQTKEIFDRLPEIKQKIQRIAETRVDALEIANDFLRHNFVNRAKEKFLDIYHDTTSEDEEKAEALYLLGQISFSNGEYSAALKDWEILIQKFPTSSQTEKISTRLTQLRQVITSDVNSSIVSVVAQSYLKNGDFWSNAIAKFNIDSSWMNNVEIAVEWYDKVLAEFPNSNAAELAYRKKLFTLLGWEEEYGAKFGLKKDFNKYINQIVETFEEYEANFPQSSHLQGFRYQIAQAYWLKRDWTNARKWLNLIIEKAGDQSTFYAKTAKERLKKLKY